jgi:hypothetical protein
MAEETAELKPAARSKVPDGAVVGHELDEPAWALHDRRLGNGLGRSSGELPRPALRRPAASLPSTVLETVRAPGEALDPALRDGMARRFRHDFSDVRIHADDQAADATQALDATAFTVGRHIAFAPGAFTQSTSAGQRLLAHELAHVVQQRAAAPPALERMRLGHPHDAFERQADAAAAAVFEGRTPATLPGRTPSAIVTIQRQHAATQTREATTDAPGQEQHPPTDREVDELDYAFFFTGGPYGEAARAFVKRYYPHHQMVAAASFEDLFDRLANDTQPGRHAHRPHVHELVIVTHANAAGGLKIPLARGDLAAPLKNRRFFSPWDVADLQREFRQGVHKQFRQRRRDVVARAVDANTQITVRGCEFGQSDDALTALRALFGGQPTVWAPRGFQGYEVLGIGRSFLKKPEQAFDWLVAQGYLPPEMQPTPDEDKVKYIARVFGIHGAIPAQFFVMGQTEHDELAAQILAGTGRTDEAEKHKVRDQPEPGTSGEYWNYSASVPSDPELDKLSIEEIEARARRLNNPYRPQNAAMLERLRHVWERKTTEEFARTGQLRGDPHDPLTGLPPTDIFGDSNIVSGDAARFPGPRIQLPDAFEKETLKFREPTSAGRESQRTFVEPPADAPTDEDRPPDEAPTSEGGIAPEPAKPTGAGGAGGTTRGGVGGTTGRQTGGGGAGATLHGPTAGMRQRARNFSKGGQPAPAEPEIEETVDDLGAIDGLDDPVLRAILDRSPQDSGHFWDKVDLGVSVYSGLANMPWLANVVEGTLVAESMEIAGLVEPLVALVALAVTFSDAEDAQIVGARKLGVRLGLEAALSQVIRGGEARFTTGGLEGSVGNHPDLLAQITYSYPLGPDGARENFRDGLAAAATAANTAVGRVEERFRARLARSNRPAGEVAHASDVALPLIRTAALAQLYRSAVARMRARHP